MTESLSKKIIEWLHETGGEDLPNEFSLQLLELEERVLILQQCNDFLMKQLDIKSEKRLKEIMERP